MGILFLGDEQFVSKEIMEVYNNPNKRIRLDLANNFDANLPNDDLWGDDLTAEEFDMLEVQATQSHKQDDAATFLQPLPPLPLNHASQPEVDDPKQQLYELEGKVKLLTQSLEAVSSQLKEEKMKRDQIVSDKMQQSRITENDLQRKIKKAESSLQFKDQEMKSVYEKLQLLETQLKEKKELHLRTIQTSNCFLEKCNFVSDASGHKVELDHDSKPKSRKFKLLVDTPRGENQGTDIISTILCNRLSGSPVQKCPATVTQAHHSLESTMKHCSQLSSVSILRLSLNQQTEELFDYFSFVFKNYLKLLKSAKKATLGSNTNSPASLRRKEANPSRGIVITCLKDLTYILSSSQFLSVIQKYSSEERNSNQMTDLPSTSAVHVNPVCNQKTDEPVIKKIHSLLQSLVSLASPDSYPVNYLKNEEIELSLASLVSWSALAPESFIQLSEEIPYHSIMCCYENTTCLLLSLKLMTNLCIHKELINVLLHKDDSCLLCTICTLTLQKISQNPLKYATIMLLIEDFLSALFTIHSFQELKLECSPCATLVLQAIVISLWKFHEVYQESNHSMKLILKKGFVLIQLLSRYLPNFKERRSSFEDSYISLVCGMLTLSKENPTFKEFYDLIHDLWDFQEDTSEFDLDEPSSEESSQMVEIISLDCH